MRRRYIIGLPLLLLLFAALIPFPTRNRLSWIDPITGAMKYQNVTFGHAHPPTIRLTALDHRMAKLGIPHQPDWQFIHDHMMSLWGGTRGWGCGTAPPIYSFATTGALAGWVAKATDDEIRLFVTTMQTGGEDQQKAAVEAAFEKSLSTAN